MAEVYKPGVKLSSTVCKTQIMALRVPGDAIDITCGGAPMQVGDPESLGDMSADAAAGTLVGKRYVDEGETMEFLCTRGGEGSVAINGTLLGVKQAKQLPSSD